MRLFHNAGAQRRGDHRVEDLENWDTLVLTRICFAVLLILKTMFYIYVLFLIRRNLGPKHIRIFLRHYVQKGHLLIAAWRLGLFFSLFVSYVGLVFAIRVKDLSSPIDPNNILAWFWGGLLALLVVRTFLQTIGELLDLESSLKSLKRTLLLKAGFRYMNHAANLVGFIYPLVAFQGWAAWALWSKRALIIGRGVALFEKWFDHRVSGEVRQFVLASVGAAIFETFLRLILIALALFQSNMLEW
jgi:hypothetical protein